MKKLVVVLTALMLAAVMALPVFASGSKESSSASSSAAAPKKPYNIALIIKATDSDFWQYVIIGGQNYALDNPDQAKVTTYGPPSEADIDKQVAILENVVANKPDAIVIASTSSDATVPAIERAVSEGIPVVTIDNKVNTDKVAAHFATNNLVGGALAATQLVDFIKASGRPLQGSVGVISAMAGIQVLTDRDTGFTNKLKELAPNVKILQTRYTDNDIVKALSAAEDMITSEGDNLLGIFADNNHTGDGVARAITERKLEGKVSVTAFDSDPEEVSALKTGAIGALILQDPYGMGYKGVQAAVTLLDGGTVAKYVDTGVTAVTKTNMDQEKIKALLDPTTLKRSK